MKKESKNLGANKACPTCKRTIMAEGNILGIGYLVIECPHCLADGVKTHIRIDITQKTSYKVTAIIPKFIALVLLAGTIAFGWKTIQAERLPKINCASFNSRLEAQIAYDGNPKKYKALNKDNDKFVCEYYDYSIKKTNK